MRYIECPENLVVTNIDEEVMFMAGGITNCPNWQQDYRSLLEGVKGLVVLNPRRANFDTRKTGESEFQIEWEHRHLMRSDVVSFWFPMETLCPITLFELGKISATPKFKIFVGTHPDYQRKFDVIHQLALVRPEVTVVHSLEELSQQVIDFMQVSET